MAVLNVIKLKWSHVLKLQFGMNVMLVGVDHIQQIGGRVIHN